MAFWSSQTLESKLASLVAPASAGAIDCNAITLTVGPEIYITPTLEGNLHHSHTKKQLSTDESFAIPPGQFAFLLTDEVVTVPPDAMAFISMKATFKLALASLVVAVMTLAPAAANASRPGSAHMRARQFHDRAPRVHDHGAQVHHS